MVVGEIVQVVLHRRENAGDTLIGIYADRIDAVACMRQIEDRNPEIFISPRNPSEWIIIEPCRIK